MKCASQAAAGPSEEIWVDWVNAVLRQHDLKLDVKDVRRDLSDGTVLAALVECLGHTKLPAIYRRPTSRTQKVQNLGTVLMFVRDRGLSLGGVTPQSLLDGSLLCIVQLLDSLRQLKDKVSEPAKTKQVKELSKTRLPLPNRGLSLSLVAQKSQKPELPKRQQKRRYTISSPVQAASSSVFNSFGLKQSQIDGNSSFVATAREAFEKLAEQNTQVPKPRPRLLQTSSSASKLEVLKEHLTVSDHNHGVVQNSSRKMQGSENVSRLPLVSTVIPAVESDRNHGSARTRSKISCIHMSPLNESSWENSRELELAGVHHMNSLPEKEDCATISTSSDLDSEYLHGMVSQLTGHQESGIVDFIHEELPCNEHRAQDAIEPQQGLTTDPDCSQKQASNETLISSLRMPMSQVLMDSSGSEQNVKNLVSEDGSNGEAYFYCSSSVDTVIAARSTSSSMVSINDAAVQQLEECSSSTIEQWAAAEHDDAKLERDVSSFVCSSGQLQLVKTSGGVSSSKTMESEPPKLPMKFGYPVATGQTDQMSNDPDDLSVVSATSLQKQDSRENEQAGYYADKEISSDHDVDSGSSLETPTDAAVDGMMTTWTPPVEQKLPNCLDTVHFTRGKLSEQMLKIPEFNCKATVRRTKSFSSVKLGSASSQLSSEKTSVAEMDGEFVRTGKEQTLAQNNITVRRLRRELESADSKASGLTSKLKSSMDKVVAYEEHIGRLQRQLKTVLEESQMKDSEITRLKTTLQSLEEEVDDAFGNKTEIPAYGLEWPLQEDVAVSLERDSENASQSTAKSPCTNSGSFMGSYSDKKRKRASWKPALPFLRKKSSTSSGSSDVSMLSGSGHRGTKLNCSLNQVMEDKAFNGISQLEGQLMDSQAEIARLALTNEAALRDTQSLHTTVRNLEEQLSDFMRDVDRNVSSPISSDKSEDRPYSPRASSTPVSPLPEFLTDDELSDNQKVSVYVHVGEDYKDQEVVAIATMLISVNTAWNVADSKVLSTLEHYLSKLDGKAQLGLNRHSVAYYWLGDVRRVVGAKLVDQMSPHQAVMGNKATAVLHLQGAHKNRCDALSFHTLFPKRFLQAYTSLLISCHRVLITGPKSSGKSFLAAHLVNFCLMKLGVHVPDEAVTVCSMDGVPPEETGEMVRQLLKHTEQKHSCYAAIIFDDLRSFEQLGKITQMMSLSSVKNIMAVATMTLSKDQKVTAQELSQNLWTWRQIQLWCNSEPVHSLLECFLSRRLIQANIQTGENIMELTAAVKWVCQVWHRVNRVLDCCSGIFSARGPCQFFDCPMNVKDMQLWFTLLWNHLILPYLSLIVRLSASEESLSDYDWKDDPVGWILEGVPWRDQLDCPPLLRLRASDLGLDRTLQKACRIEEPNGSRDQFLQQMARVLRILVDIPSLPPFPPAAKQAKRRTALRHKAMAKENSFKPDVVQSVL